MSCKFNYLHKPPVVQEIKKLVPRLRHDVKPKHYNLSNPLGPLGRVIIIRRVLTALFKFERIETYQHYCEEVRGYAERLIIEAMRHGDNHQPTMDMADFWLEDKQMIHKLFKVLVPRFQDYKISFTDTFLLPDNCEACLTEKRYLFYPRFVLELRGNPFPPMPRKKSPNEESLTNILLREAAKEFRREKQNAATTGT